MLHDVEYRLRRYRLARLAAPILALATLLSPALAATPVEAIEVSARPVTQFRIGHEEKNFGPLEFVGGIEMTSSSRNFGSVSAMRFLKPGSDFIGVTDTGFWLFGSIVHDAGQRPAGVRNFRMQQMVDVNGKPADIKWEVDAEGLGVKDGVASVGFERDHRVSQFKITPDDMTMPFGNLDFLVPAHELRQNRGFETVTWSSPAGPLKGALVVVSEKSLDKAGNIFAAVLDGPRKGVFTVRREGDFDITDGAFLPGGDLLLLERSFSMARGVRMRLRRIAGDSIAKGALVTGPVLFEADMAYQIDNMEALDIWIRNDGATIVSLMSDDNQSILQRNLYLEFVLHDD
ncbi:esterase-like activity of phytase family protein [Mesorhizobium sp. Root157]|uniref:esterase-like activity of phytase family protein n=1 Tax=Mesorhizobium sp. Root157 TaxID=1736477 RepID=UPI0009E6E0D4|nr:esterase-like activity of phytase family protein [Mesorhizobium sp. Root157]